MAWLLAYVAAMFLIALPVAVSRGNVVAAIIFSVWSIGQIAYVAGFPEPITQAFIYAVAFSYCLTMIFLRPHRWSARCIGASVVFLALGAVCWQWATTPGMEPWWDIYWLAWAQLILAVRPRSLIAAYKGIRFRKTNKPDVLQMVAA